jgi:hypothetical protein
MTKNMTTWQFCAEYPVPVNIGNDGEIKWEVRSEYCQVKLPSHIQNPKEYLGQLSRDEQVDIIGFTCFVDAAA